MTKTQKRRELIINQLMETPKTTVSDLSQQFKVSEVTIRSDLKQLSSQGLINRRQGGALPAFHAQIMEQQRRSPAEKIRIARAAAGLIDDLSDVMISSGTTTSLIPRFLIGRDNVKIVSNSTLILPYIRTSPRLQTTLTGGEFRPAFEALTGSATISELKKFHVSIAFIGADGISVEKGITADNTEIADVCRHMLLQAKKTIVVADASKIGRVGFANITKAANIDLLITSKEAPAAEIRELAKAGVEVLLV
ncbi:MAG: DeoR/GlpR family DNA-binding transcription regulator [Kiritimatiellae bacterium]|jgi:DeoR/GlpR family transcriptional regulator of sugar metabolism|nr:DeoR/GlpR family DNA-binding transcription regulator [Kiritimatiellia bacterium]